MIFQMKQLSSMVKTFVEGQESMLESLDEMIERQSHQQVSRILQDYCTAQESFLFLQVTFSSH